MFTLAPSTTNQKITLASHWRLGTCACHERRSNHFSRYTVGQELGFIRQPGAALAIAGSRNWSTATTACRAEGSAPRPAMQHAAL